MRIVPTEESNEEITSFLRSENVGVPSLDAKGARGNVKMSLTLVNRIDVPCITEHLQSTTPHAFFSIEDVRYANEGGVPTKKTQMQFRVCFMGLPAKNNNCFLYRCFAATLISDNL